MSDCFDDRIIALLNQPRLIDGRDNVCMNTGWLWSLKRKRDYEKQFGPVPDWVLSLHLHLRCNLCGIAIEAGQPLPLFELGHCVSGSRD